MKSNRFRIPELTEGCGGKLARITLRSSDSCFLCLCFETEKRCFLFPRPNEFSGDIMEKDGISLSF